MNVKASREACRYRAQLGGFNRLVERTTQIIADALNAVKKPYIAFSGGKDSHVVLHLARSINPNIPALTGYDDWHLPETLDLINATPNLTKIAATIWHSDFFTSYPDGKPESLPENAVWFDAVKNSRIAPYAKSQGFDCCLLGLRKAEATYRRLHLCSKGTFFFCRSHQMFECNPIADWRVEDVWAYLLSKDVAYNKAYDKLTAMNIPLEAQRVGPFAVEKVLGFGQLAILKRGWADLFNQFVEKYPQARAYV